MNSKIQVIILAAGKGKRMKSDEPKALALLKGKPLLQYILETLKKLDPEIRPVIVVGHKKERVIEELGNEYIYAEQHEQLGTGHAVGSAKSAIKTPHDIVIVLATDQPLVSKETLKQIISTHAEKNPTITMATVIIPDFKDWRIGLNHFGRIIRNENGKIKKIVEFKDTTEEEKEIKELNPALYAFDAKWLWENIDKLKNENAQKEYLLTDLIKMAFDQNKNIELVQTSNIFEALQPNSQEELELLEKLVK